MEGELSRAERKRLKRERKKQEKERQREESIRKGRTRKIVNYGIVLLVILALAGYFYFKSIPPKNAPIIDIEPDSYNMGTVSQAVGVVTTTMNIYNRGTEELVIGNIDTTCGCTSASVIYKGVEGPRFSMAMHGTNPKGWKQAIPPGESAQLKIYYDPNVHEDLRGMVSRSVHVFSNDPRQSKAEVTIYGNQVP